MHIPRTGQLAYIPQITLAPPANAPMSGFAAALGVRLAAYAAGQFCPACPMPPISYRRPRRAAALTEMYLAATDGL